MADCLEQQAVLDLPGNDRRPPITTLGPAGTRVQPQARFLLLRSMACQAVLDQQWPNTCFKQIPVVLGSGVQPRRVEYEL